MAQGTENRMPTVIVAPPLQGPTAGVSRVDIGAANVRQAMAAVDARFPGFADQIFASDGVLHRYVQIFHNGKPVAPDGLGAAVDESDEIEVVAAIAGG
jgi:hypothetical protein